MKHKATSIANVFPPYVFPYYPVIDIQVLESNEVALNIVELPPNI